MGIKIRPLRPRSRLHTSILQARFSGEEQQRENGEEKEAEGGEFGDGTAAGHLLWRIGEIDPSPKERRKGEKGRDF